MPSTEENELNQNAVHGGTLRLEGCPGKLGPGHCVGQPLCQRTQVVWTLKLTSQAVLPSLPHFLPLFRTLSLSIVL